MKAKRQESSVAPERSTDEATYRVQDVPKHLVITNGDIAAASLLGIGAADEVLAWRDVLHEGPVPATATLAELSAIRAAFIEGAGWSGPDVAADFAARDAVLLANDAFETVTLWFEHDLYDQLQLIQILDWFATHPRRDPASLRLVAADTYLGEMSHEQLADLARVAAPVSDAELDLGRRAWQAFRAPSPEPVAVLAAALAARAPMAPDEARSRRDDDGVATGSAHPLPHLCAALARMLDELPDARTGLSLTEATILRLIRDGVTRPVDIFVALGDRESARDAEQCAEEAVGGPQPGGPQ